MATSGADRAADPVLGRLGTGYPGVFLEIPVEAIFTLISPAAEGVFPLKAP
jgi:hypothetical protein